MKRKNIFLGSIISLAVLATAALVMQKDRPGNTGPVLNSSSLGVKVTEDGTRYTVHPRKLRQGCPGMDCIPSIDDPSFVTGNPDWLKKGDRVIGLEINGDARAYPLKILSRHEIVNDRVGGEPVAVTYCPLCRSGVTYSREVSGETLEFGVSGKLLNANLVMYDRSTETYWSQISGEAIVGPRAGQRLDLIFSSITTWGKWKGTHPDTRTLSRRTGIYPVSAYKGSPYSGYRRSERVGFGVNNVDSRLPAKELVYGIRLGNVSKAYKAETIRKEGLIQDRVGGEPVMILERADGTIMGFRRNLEGEELNFTLEENSLRDSKGRTWSFEGKLVNSSQKLEAINPQGFYWFAWSKFNPETKLYKR